MATLHKESGLPYAVWRGCIAREAKEEATNSRKRKADTGSNTSGSSSVAKKKKLSSSATKSSSGATKSSHAAGSSSTSNAEFPSNNIQPSSDSVNDKLVMLSFLTYGSESNVRNMLARGISEASPTDLEAYKTLFDPLLTRFRTPLHCVRCHETYLESENGSRACKIPHDEPEYLGDDATEDDLLTLDEMGEEDGLMRYPCCEERVWENDLDDGKAWPCVEERHTTYSQEVKYYLDPKVAAKNGQKTKIGYTVGYRDAMKRNNSHVVTCKKKKCSRD